ncbi:hypothetical protein NMG60_11021842 [Bertholletia excelsa]
MDVRNWCSSGYEELEQVKFPVAPRSRRPMWKVLWTKLMNEKRKMSEPPVPVKAPYDEYSYSQNFDQGMVMDEADVISRTFSVRFSDPSRVLFKEGGLQREQPDFVNLFVDIDS